MILLSNSLADNKNDATGLRISQAVVSEAAVSRPMRSKGSQHTQKHHEDKKSVSFSNNSEKNSGQGSNWLSLAVSMQIFCCCMLINISKKYAQHIEIRMASSDYK